MQLLDLRHYTADAKQSRIWHSENEHLLCVDRTDAQRTLLQFFRLHTTKGISPQTVRLPAAQRLLDLNIQSDCVRFLTASGCALYRYDLPNQHDTPILMDSYRFCAPVIAALQIGEAVLVSLQMQVEKAFTQQVQKTLGQDYITMLWCPTRSQCVCLRDYTLSCVRADAFRLLPSGLLLAEHRGAVAFLAAARPENLIEAACAGQINLPAEILERVQNHDTVQYLMADQNGVWYGTTFSTSGLRKLIYWHEKTGTKEYVDTSSAEHTAYQQISGLGFCRISFEPSGITIQPFAADAAALQLPASLRELYGYINGCVVAWDGRCTVLFDIGTRTAKCYQAKAAVLADHIFLY